MTAAMRRVTPLLAVLLLGVVVVGFVGRSCSRLQLRSRSFVVGHAPARLPQPASRHAAR
jgi:hypothetical protein